jgi:hypothetical protein
MRAISLSLFFAVAFESASLFASAHNALATSPESREPFYRQQTSLSIGPILLIHPSIYTITFVPPTPDSKASGYDVVDELKLKEGTEVAIYSDNTHTGIPLLTAKVAKGFPTDPSGELIGRFSWKDSRLEKVTLSRLKLRLTNVEYRRNIFGGTLTLPASHTALLTNASTLTATSSDVSGAIRLEGLSGNVKAGIVTWGELTVPADFKATELCLSFNLDGRPVSIVDGYFLADSDSVGTAVGTISDFVPKHSVEAASMRFKGMRLAVHDGTATMSADSATINPTAVIFKPNPGLKVAAVKDMFIDQFGPSHCELPIDRPACDKPQSLRLVIHPNPYLVIAALNSYGLFAPQDYLLPTGLADTQYISLTALESILSGNVARQNEIWTKHKTQIGPICPPIEINGGVATQMDPHRVEDYKAKLLEIDPDAEELVLGVLGPASVAGEDIGGALLRMLFGSPTLAGKAASRNLLLLTEGSALNPRFGKVAFELAYISAARVKTIIGQAADMLAEKIWIYAYNPATDMILKANQDLKQLIDSYQSSALPATLRYSERIRDYYPWQVEQQTILQDLIRTQNSEDEQAAALNSETNAAATAAAIQQSQDAQNKLTQNSSEGNGGVEAPQGNGSKTLKGGNGQGTPGKIETCMPKPCTVNPPPVGPQK